MGIVFRSLLFSAIEIKARCFPELLKLLFSLRFGQSANSIDFLGNFPSHRCVLGRRALGSIGATACRSDREPQRHEYHAYHPHSLTDARCCASAKWSPSSRLFGAIMPFLIKDLVS